jgi:hypothetical protein
MSDIFDQPDVFNESDEHIGEADAGTVDQHEAAEPTSDSVCDRERQGKRAAKGRPRDRTARKRARRRGSRSSRALSLAVMAREYIWLWDVQHGVSISEIAIREGLDIQRVRIGVARARTLEKSGSNEPGAVYPPRLIPLFPIGAYTPQSTCAHQGPIESGSLLCCMICHCSGVDDHPGLLRSPLTDQEPEPKPAPAPAPAEKRAQRETRRERRQRLFGTQMLATSA